MSSLREHPDHELSCDDKRSPCRAAEDHSLKFKRRACNENWWVRLTRPATVSRNTSQCWVSAREESHESWGSAFIEDIIIPYLFSRATLVYREITEISTAKGCLADEVD